MMVNSKSLGSLHHALLKGSKCTKTEMRWRFCMSIADPLNNLQVLSSGDIKGKIIKDRVMLASVSESISK